MGAPASEWASRIPDGPAHPATPLRVPWSWTVSPGLSSGRSSSSSSEDQALSVASVMANCSATPGGQRGPAQQGHGTRLGSGTHSMPRPLPPTPPPPLPAWGPGPTPLTCGEACLSELVREAAVVFVLRRGRRPARPWGAPALPLDEVCHAATCHGRGLGDVVLDALHHAWGHGDGG